MVNLLRDVTVCNWSILNRVNTKQTWLKLTNRKQTIIRSKNTDQ